TADGKKAGLLLQGDKDNYRAILTALEGATGAPLSVSEKDREYVPGLPNVQTARETSDAKADSANGSSATGHADAAQVKQVAATEKAATATLTLKSTPDAADVSVDGNFMGNTPASLKLAAGKHTVTVSHVGYNDWSREITVSAGSEMTLSAEMDKE